MTLKGESLKSERLHQKNKTTMHDLLSVVVLRLLSRNKGSAC